MALTPEDGTGLANADAFVSLAEANAYHAAHGAPAAWSGESEPNREAAIRAATVVISHGYNWPGAVVKLTQALAWPRSGGYDSERRPVDPASVPQRVKDATCILALSHIVDGPLAGTESSGLEELGLGGGLSLKFRSGQAMFRRHPMVEFLLGGLVAVGLGPGQRWTVPG